MGTLALYRDDGPLTVVTARLLGRTGAPAFALMLVGMALLFTCLAVEGGRPGPLTLVGFTAFFVLASAAAVAESAISISWLLPPLTRAAEYGFVVWLGWAAGPSASGVAYGLLAAVAFHHYDIVYRLRHQKVAPPRWLSALGGGWDLRMAVLLVAALMGVFTPVAVALAFWCAGLFSVESIRSWTMAIRREREHQTSGQGV